MTSRHVTERIVITLCFAALCLAAYANSIHNDFLMDDYPMLIRNRHLGSPSFLQLVFTRQPQQLYFRPVTHLLNLITYIWFGQNPVGYHLFNLLLFYLACLSLYKLLTLIIKDRHIPLLTCIFFCTHPINGVLVNYKNASGYAFLVLAVHLSLIHFITAGEHRNKPILRTKIPDYALGLTWLLAALLCHEIVLAYPFYLAAILWYIKKTALKDILISFLIISIVFIPYALLRAHFFELKAGLIGALHSLQIPFINFFATYVQLILWYFSKLFTLKGIVLMWDTPVIRNPASAWGLGLLGGMAFLGVLWRLAQKTKGGEIPLALSWIGIGFLPVAWGCLSRPLFGIIIEPHWLVFSSMGYFLLMAVLIAKIRNFVNPRLYAVFLVTIGLAYLTSTWNYNYLWGDQKRYCRYWRSLSPNAYWPNFWLGYSYLEEKNYSQAREPFGRILENGVRDFETLGNLGLIEYRLGNLPAALKYFQESLAMNPRHADTYHYIGDIYLESKQLKMAESFFAQAVRLDPSLVDSKRKLALIQQGQDVNSEGTVTQP
jgi:tetratricopeptide (TPR) repeat protein